jgi:HEAT repeat protein
LAKDSPVKDCLGDAGLACADGLLAAGKVAQAADLYWAIRHARVAKHITTAALGREMSLADSGGENVVRTLTREPRDKDEFNLGLALARIVRGATVSAAVSRDLEKLPADRQALVLRALGDRKDPIPLPVILAATKSPSPAVREAAIRVLAKHGDASAVAILLEAALGEGAVAAAAKEGLKGISGQEVDAAIAAKLARADAKAKAVLFELVGARRIMAAEPAVRAALDDSNEPVRLAAITAMGQLAELKDLELLISRALRGEGAEGTTAQRALRTAALRMSDRDGTAAKLAECLKGASAANQQYLLELVGKISGPKALEIVASSAKSGDPAVKDVATRVLGNWVNADAAPALLEIAKSDPDSKYQIRALRGYIRIARQLQLPEAKRLEMFRTAMEVAKRADEKQLALAVLTRIPSAETLQLAVSHLDQAGLKNAAAQAAVGIAPKIVNRNAKAVAEAMQKVLDSGIGGKPAAQAKQLLGQAKGGK